MGRVLCCLIMFLATLPRMVHAAGNPVVDALAQGAVVQYSGKEAVSNGYDFELTIATGDKNLNLASAVGQPIAVPVAQGRIIAGMIERIEQIDAQGVQGLYRLHIVPGMNRLKYRTASRTFYGKSVPDIATQLFNEAGVGSVELRLTATMQPEEMTVQYQETDLAFVSRLLEGAGIHYHIEVTSTGEKLVLSDGNAGFPSSPVGKLTFATNGSPAVFSFARGLSMHSGQIQAGDYNWKTPGSDLSITAQTTLFADLTERVFPAGSETKTESQTAANLRLAARIAEAQSCSGESTYPQLQAGQRVGLTNHPRADFNQEYVITAVEHQKTGKEYRNTFRCLPAQVVFRPPATTPTPVVAGVLPALVTGPPGETKYVDQFGRIKVRFPWRSAAHSNPNESGDAGFVRVAQIATGVGSSSMWLPDVGDEVLVAFEHGDPRRPVVVGSVFNAKDMPPVALPANKHLSILRQQGANGVKTEVVYDGTAGNERLLIQAGQTGLAVAANGLSVQAPAIAMTSTGDLVQRAGRTVSLEAAADLAMKSGQSTVVTSQKDAVITVGGTTQLNIGGAFRATVGSDAQMTVGASMVVEAAKDASVRVGQNFLLQSGRGARFTAAEDMVMQTGQSFITNSGAMFQFVAAQAGFIKVGEASFNIKRDGDIIINGKDIAVASSGNLTMKSNRDLILKGSKITQN